MEITVKNLKIAEFASEETLCFEATVYIDGVRAFTAYNQGHGGCNMYHPVNEKGRELLAAAEKWAKEQPEVVCEDLHDPHNPKEKFSYQPDLDHFVDKAVNTFDIQRRIKRDLGKKLTIYRDGKIYTVNCKPNEAKGRLYVQKNHPDAVILNDVPIEKAVSYYEAQAGA